jgi:O-antigen/teichoic acid export membrane protein
MYRRLKEKAFRFLRWSERYTKTDMVYTASGGFWLGLGRIVSSLTAFLLSVAFANLFPKEAFGVYRYVLSLAGVIGSFALTGMGTAVTQSVARGFDGTLPEAFKMTLRWTLGTAGISFAVALYYFINNNHTIGWALVIAGICVPLLKSAGLFDAFLTGKKDFSKKTAYGLIYDILPALALAGALFFTNNALVMVTVYFVSYAIISLFLYLLTLKTYGPKTNNDPKARGYAIHLSIMNVLGGVSSQIDRVLLFHFLGPTHLAIYSFAQAVPQQLKYLQKLVGTLSFPRFSQRSISSIAGTIWHKALIMFIVMAGMTSAYIVVAPFIFEIFFPQYLESVYYSQIFSLALLISPSVLFKQALVAHARTRALYISQISTPALKIGILALLIPFYGIMGAIIGYIAAEVINLSLGIVLFHRSVRDQNLTPRPQEASDEVLG